VLVTISDKKIGVDQDNDGQYDYYKADVVTANDYYPFGMQMPGRTYAQGNSSYRYGFNGKENDNEVKGQGNQQDYGMRIYDPRVGRFLSVDPLQKDFADLSPYQFSENDVIRSTDLDGLEKQIAIDGSTVAGPVRMDNANDEILKMYSKAQQQAMKQSASMQTLISANSKPVTPMTPPAKRVGTSDHHEDFAARKASEQKLIFTTTQAQSNKQFAPPQAEF